MKKLKILGIILVILIFSQNCTNPVLLEKDEEGTNSYLNNTGVSVSTAVLKDDTGQTLGYSLNADAWIITIATPWDIFIISIGRVNLEQQLFVLQQQIVPEQRI